MGSLAFMVGDAMCCAVGPNGVPFRVAPEDRAGLLTRADVIPMALGGRVMRGFVRVAPAGYRTAAALADWIERGVAAGNAKRASARRLR